MNTQSAEDKLLLSKAYDAIELSERIGAPRFLGFLNEHESLYLREHLPKRADIRFFGGYEDATRLMLGAGAEEGDFPIVPLELSYKPEFDLRHRDFLGSLMGLGIRRDTVGDILVTDGRAVIFAREDVAPFILSQVEKIGRVGVKVFVESSRSPMPQSSRGTRPRGLSRTKRSWSTILYRRARRISSRRARPSRSGNTVNLFCQDCSANPARVSSGYPSNTIDRIGVYPHVND